MEIHWIKLVWFYFQVQRLLQKKMNIQGHKASMLLGLSITVSKRFDWIVRVKAPGQTMFNKVFF